MMHRRHTLLFVALLLGSCRPVVPSVDLLILTPLDVEFAAAKAALASGEARDVAGREAFVGRAPSGASVAVIRTGWGKAHASGATAAGIAAFAPKRIVLAGIGGGIDAETGDVVVGFESYQHDLGKADAGGFERWNPEDPREGALPARYKADATLARELQQAATGITWQPWKVSECECRREKTAAPCNEVRRPVGRIQGEVRAGLIATGDVFVVDSALVARLRDRDGAMAIDMEAAAVAQEALTQRVPFATVRVIADVAGQPESESLYHCVKPQAGKRLEDVLRRWLRGPDPSHSP